MARSLEDRLNFILEEDGACASCSGGGGSEGGGGDFTSGSEDSGPTAGYDQLLKGLKMLKRKPKKAVKESKKDVPSTAMTLKASDLDMKAEKEKDKNKKFKLFDRARKIRSEIK